ncbi:MAG: hypothetical protein JSR82_17785 [Verrucomicrobia bacterium]|nr:hypothetical protein [Verrucomicrobiota bacterium]
MEALRTLVTFQAQLPDPSESAADPLRLARALIERLRAQGVATEVEPREEDFGGYFGFRVGETDYQFFLGLRPADEEEPAMWVGWLERKVGFLGSLFGGRDRDVLSDSVAAMHAAISELPQVAHLRWHRKEDFDAGEEGLGTEDPAG